MGAADVGDEAVVRLAHAHELRYVVGVVGSHFDHCDFRIRAHGQQRQRHADVVVQVAFGGAYAVFFREHCAEEVLGGGLAVGSREPYHREPSAAKVGAMPYCKLLQGGECVVGEDQPLVLRKAGPVGDSPCGAFFQCREGVVVAVEILAAQREENLAAGDFAAVGRDPAPAVQIYRIKFFY